MCVRGALWRKSGWFAIQLMTSIIRGYPKVIPCEDMCCTGQGPDDESVPLAILSPAICAVGQTIVLCGLPRLGTPPPGGARPPHYYFAGFLWAARRCGAMPGASGPTGAFTNQTNVIVKARMRTTATVNSNRNFKIRERRGTGAPGGAQGAATFRNRRRATGSPMCMATPSTQDRKDPGPQFRVLMAEKCGLRSINLRKFWTLYEYTSSKNEH
jgi:hypothetical protein